jgi:hypothetical protein
MTDTPPEIAERYHRLLMERSGEERLRMACAMFDTARRLVLASLGRDFAAPGQRNAALFLRLYGADFDPSTRARIATHLRALATAEPAPSR